MTRENISRNLLAVSSDGKQFNVYLKIGKAVKDNKGNWVVQFSVKPFENSTIDTVGYDSWQATKLAMDTGSSILRKFIRDGGKLFLEEDDDELSIEDV